MTDDLVKRLRSNRPIPTLPHEAADRIEALTAENERFREGLNAIVDRAVERDRKWIGMTARDIARAALAKKP